VKGGAVAQVPKAQLIAKHLLATGLLKPSSLDLPKKLDDLEPENIDWASIRRPVNRLSVRELIET
jgi:hypothetical protein